MRHVGRALLKPLLMCVVPCLVLVAATGAQVSAQDAPGQRQAPVSASSPPAQQESVAPAPAQPPQAGPEQPPAPPEPTTEAISPGLVDAAQLPRDLSPWSMFASADIVVQAVMLGLAFASLITWTVWFAKSVELFAARRRLGKALAAISDERTLAGAAARVGGGSSIAASFIVAAAHELQLSADASTREGIKERVASRLARLEAAATRRMNRGTGVLATIGSTAPFVGLFGTVWGIMNSFIGISKAQTTNLAVVAPGIAEALLATAIGLFAAIPAVIIYNQFARWIGGYRGQLGDASAAVLRLVSRDLDRGTGKPDLARAAE